MPERNLNLRNKGRAAGMVDIWVNITDHFPPHKFFKIHACFKKCIILFGKFQCIYMYCTVSRFSRGQLCATPEMAAHQAPPSLAFSRQEHWSGLPFPSPVHESEKWKWSRSVVSDSLRPHGLQPTRLLRPWDFPGKSTVTHNYNIKGWRHLCEVVKY